MLCTNGRIWIERRFVSLILVACLSLLFHVFSFASLISSLNFYPRFHFLVFMLLLFAFPITSSSTSHFPFILLPLQYSLSEILMISFPFIFSSLFPLFFASSSLLSFRLFFLSPLSLPSTHFSFFLSSLLFQRGCEVSTCVNACALYAHLHSSLVCIQTKFPP